MKRTADRLLRVALPPLLCFALVILAWHLAVDLLAIKPFLLPGPLDVAGAMAKHANQLLTGAWLTLSSALTGFILSFLCGVLIALLFSQSRLIERSLYPYAIFLQTVPIVAIAPLIVLWIGHGFYGVVAVSFIISLFPVIVNTTTGLTSVEPALLDLFALNNANRWQLLTKLRLPHAVPHMLTGAKISSGLSVIGAIVGDFFAGFSTDDFGLGYYILMTNAQGKTDFLFACIVFCTLLGLAIFTAISLLSNFIMARWGGGPPS
ncbi:MAG: ABC transporter permease subunit [Candidatus Latescibacteria bacterium]|nr:ABC transporter permease subunit [Candidatus Latescibacterota bacterium]